MKRMLLLLSLVAPWPASAEGGDAMAGEQLADRWCAGCHALNSSSARAADTAPPFVAIARQPGRDTSYLRTFLAVPHGQMPPLSLTNKQIDDLAAFILLLK